MPPAPLPPKPNKSRPSQPTTAAPPVAYPLPAGKGTSPAPTTTVPLLAPPVAYPPNPSLPTTTRLPGSTSGAIPIVQYDRPIGPVWISEEEKRAAREWHEAHKDEVAAARRQEAQDAAMAANPVQAGFDLWQSYNDNLINGKQAIADQYANGMPAAQQDVFAQQAAQIGQLYNYTESPEEKQRLNNALGQLMAAAGPARGAIASAFQSAVGDVTGYGRKAQQQGNATGKELADIYRQSAANIGAGMASASKANGAAFGYDQVAMAPGTASDLIGLMYAAAPREQALATQLGDIFSNAQNEFASGLTQEQAAQQAALERELASQRAAMQAQYLDREGARRDAFESSRRSALAQLMSSKAGAQLDALKYRDQLLNDVLDAKYGVPSELAQKVVEDRVFNAVNNQNQSTALPKSFSGAVKGISDSLIAQDQTGQQNGDPFALNVVDPETLQTVRYNARQLQSAAESSYASASALKSPIERRAQYEASLLGMLGSRSAVEELFKKQPRLVPTVVFPG